MDWRRISSIWSTVLAALGEEVTAIAHECYGDRFHDGVGFLPLDLSRGRRNPWLRHRLRRLVGALSPDIVHAQAGKAAALVAAIGTSARTVGTVHNVKRDLSSYRRFDAVIGVSPRVVASLDHPHKTVVYNGVSPPPAAREAAELRRCFAIGPGRTVTLAVGRLVRAKGYDRLIELWDESLGHLVVVGEGPERPRLETLAAGKPVTLAGFRADARVLMGAADLMVIASEREGFPYVLAEALRAGLPVVSTRVPGSEDLLPASHLATPERLGEAIAACLADPDGARSRMRAVFDWAADALTVEHMVRATREVYTGVVA